MKIAISAGHSSHVRGAVGYIDEYDENVRVVNEVTKNLKSIGVAVESYIDTVSKTQDENLNRIVNWHNDVAFGGGAHDYDVSVHFNSSDPDTDKPIGTECWYTTQEELAQDISAAIADATSLPDRGAKYSNGLFFLTHTREKAILIEVVFVSSRADSESYLENFDQVCVNIAETLAGGEEMPAPEPPEGALFTARGRCSWFGGPEDTGVSASEGLAFIYDYDDAPHLFLEEQPSGTTGLARRLNPELFYVACRWDYDVTPKTMLANPSRQALVRAKGKSFLAWPSDWGPHEQETGRAADLSPGLMAALELTTDDEVEVIYPAEQ